MSELYPILEFDPTREAVIEPSEVMAQIDPPPRCVICFFRDIIDELLDTGKLTELYRLRAEDRTIPFYSYESDWGAVSLFQAGVGAPLAAAFLEEVIALGCREFIAVGSAGALDDAIPVGHLILPTAAVRDEGVSYHYLPPSREVKPDAEMLARLEAALRRREAPYFKGKTWTTDGVYRETRGKIQRRREEGCLTVEMEAAAFFAVAKFRCVPLAQLLYAGDDVSGEVRNTRRWTSRHDVRREMVEIAVEALYLILRGVRL